MNKNGPGIEKQHWTMYWLDNKKKGRLKQWNTFLGILRENNLNPGFYTHWNYLSIMRVM